MLRVLRIWRMIALHYQNIMTTDIDAHISLDCVTLYTWETS